MHNILSTILWYYVSFMAAGVALMVLVIDDGHGGLMVFYAAVMAFAIIKSFMLFRNLLSYLETGSKKEVDVDTDR